MGAAVDLKEGVSRRGPIQPLLQAPRNHPKVFAICSTNQEVARETNVFTNMSRSRRGPRGENGKGKARLRPVRVAARNGRMLSAKRPACVRSSLRSNVVLVIVPKSMSDPMSPAQGNPGNALAGKNKGI